MKNAARSGFTLVEVLMALALVGVVTALSALLLHTTRQVTQEIALPSATEADQLRTLFRRDLDHLLPDYQFDKEEPFQFSEEEGIQLTSLRPDANGIPHPFRIHYLREGSDLIRISQGGIPLQSETNVVLRSVSRLIPRAPVDGEMRTQWPEENDESLPLRLEVEIQRRSILEDDFFTLDLPAAYRIEPEETD